ncbi:hypothetical protein AXG93_369s1040 [Marchantia polymorpha subsp. ruderalis]|uniref:Uncharacterized protein n=1 Tax=Marchantia polymorpha subsp. ruderalis TaxID=1480154 RepID=A0A176VSK3_MARPO|nr:hypothetical protein AXG93_369s1040 [Marchantia polymorpha subsp. ruderalis]
MHALAEDHLDSEEERREEKRRHGGGGGGGSSRRGWGWGRDAVICPQDSFRSILTWFANYHKARERISPENEIRVIARFTASSSSSSSIRSEYELGATSRAGAGVRRRRNPVRERAS